MLAPYIAEERLALKDIMFLGSLPVLPHLLLPVFANTPEMYPPEPSSSIGPIVPSIFGNPAVSTATLSPPLSGLEFNLRYQGQSRRLYGI